MQTKALLPIAALKLLMSVGRFGYQLWEPFNIKV
jgi:hypothetical protein